MERATLCFSRPVSNLSPQDPPVSAFFVLRLQVWKAEPNPNWVFVLIFGFYRVGRAGLESPTSRDLLDLIFEAPEWEAAVSHRAGLS